MPPRPPLPLTVDGFAGMRYTRWDAQASPSHAYLAYNAILDMSGAGSAYRGRPGRYRVSSTQLGGGGRGQLVYQFTKNDGTAYTVAIAGGKFYTLNWGSGAWTEVLSAANFSSASITLSTTARCHAVTFNNQMVVSDGTNTPWMWDGTSGAGLTKLTNAPVAYGRPTVYVAKLFFIKNTDRASIVWSEENDASTGYEAGGYSNVWPLIQTGSEGLQAIRGTNDGLYFWRTRSIGQVRGQFNANFATENTLDGVSTLVGTQSPRGVLYYNDTFYFPDQYGRPCRLRPGGAVEELWRQIALAYPQDASDDASLAVLGYEVGVTANDLAAMQTVSMSQQQKVLYGHSPSNQSGIAQFGGALYTPEGVAESLWFWDGSTSGVGSMGEVVNSVTNLPEVLCVDDDGWTFAIGKRGSWLDQDTSGSNVVGTFTLFGPRQGAGNMSVDLIFDRLDVAVDTRVAGAATYNVALLTSRVPSTLSTQSINPTTSLTVQQKHVSVGFDRQGRWAHVYVSGSTSGVDYPPTVHGWTLWALAGADSVVAP